MSTKPPHVTAAPPIGDTNRPMLLDVAGVDLWNRAQGKEEIQRWIPHRGAMCLLDYVVHVYTGGGSGIGLWHIRADEFWVPGHFPGRPMLPGVLQVEAGAQLAVYLHNKRTGALNTAAFTHIREASFRTTVNPGEDLYILAKELRDSPRRFVSEVQGVVGNKIVFEAQVEGMILR